MNPDKFTIAEHYIEVGDGHTLYVQDWGNKDAKIPIVFLHGGPGGGVGDRHKQRFVPEQERVIFFDQRGAGKSVPMGSLEHNTTADLVEDIEKIAKQLKLDTFILAGGSWGSTLALAYGLKYPQRVHTMVIDGIFAGTQAETDYLDNGEWRTFFPDIWDKYLEQTPKQWHHNPTAYHHKNMFGSDPVKAKQSAYAYAQVESALLALDDRFTPYDFDEYDPSAITIEAFYLKNGCFMPDQHILKNAHKLTMPIWLVQGRYDMVCPPVTAYSLHKKLPNSQLIWVTAGHGNDRPKYDVIRSLLLQMTS
jgi:proline iminopeptidase